MKKKERKVNDMGKLKVAVIGCGAIAPFHLDAISAIDEVELVAVCDIKQERALGTAHTYHTKAYTDYREMFLCETLDAIHICLPHYLHTKVAREAFQKGIHVISEKPMSISYEDAVSTVEYANACHVQYGVIFQGRYNTHAKAVKQRILDGRLGEVQCANAMLLWHRTDEYYNTSDWKGTWEKEGGGVLINQAIHTLDLANWFVGDSPMEIQASISNRSHPDIEVEDTAEGMIEYENGARVLFYFTNNFVTDEPIELRLLCKNGRVVMSSDEAKIYYQDGSFEEIKNLPMRSSLCSQGKSYWGTRHAEQIYQFYQALLGKECLEVSGKEALQIQKLVSDIYKTGRKDTI